MNQQQMANQNQISQLLGRINVPGGGGGGNLNQQQQMQMNPMNPTQQMNPNSGGMIGGIVGQQQQQQPQQMGGANVMVGQMPQQQQLNANQMGGAGSEYMNLINFLYNVKKSNFYHLLPNIVFNFRSNEFKSNAKHAAAAHGS